MVTKKQFGTGKKGMEVISLNSADAMLFDLGGVVIEVDFSRAFARWASHSNQSLDVIKGKFCTG